MVVRHFDGGYLRKRASLCEEGSEKGGCRVYLPREYFVSQVVDSRLLPALGDDVHGSLNLTRPPKLENLLPKNEQSIGALKMEVVWCWGGNATKWGG